MNENPQTDTRWNKAECLESLIAMAETFNKVAEPSRGVIVPELVRLLDNTGVPSDLEAVRRMTLEQIIAHMKSLKAELEQQG